MCCSQAVVECQFEGETLSLDPKGISFMGHVIAPLQRMVAYTLLLERILKVAHTLLI